MRIALYTLTRDRVEYTEHCFEVLHQKAGVPFDHYIVDNGSQDHTPAYLRRYKEAKWKLMLPENRGISAASNLALDEILRHFPTYDLIVKMDNDCEVVSENILGQMVEIYSDRRAFGPMRILSPRVEGINKQPTRHRHITLGGRRIGLTSIVGGLFHVVPRAVYARYRYPTSLPLAKGQDDHFCEWAHKNGAEMGYVEGLVVNHYETTFGQAARYPEYFDRKWREEKGEHEANKPS